MRGANLWAVSLPVLLLIAALMPGAGGEESEADVEPYVAVDQYQGVLPLSVAWKAEPPVTGCLEVPAPVLTLRSCGGVRVNGANTEHGYSVQEEIRTIIVELEWDAAQPLGQTMWLDTFCPDALPSGNIPDPAHPCDFKIEGESPLTIRVDDAHWIANAYDPLGEWTAHVSTSPTTVDAGVVGAGAAYQQTFSVTITRYYVESAP